MNIGDREIGPGHPPYVIAEIGVNHDGSPDRALALVEHAAESGADAVKTQVFRAELLLGAGARLAEYQRLAGEADPLEMLRRLELPMEAHADILDRAHELGLHAIATVFSEALVAPAAALGWDAFKTASPDIVHLPLLRELEATGAPLLVSTGAASLDEVQRAVGWLADARPRLALLQCVSAYPAPDECAALGAIATMARATGLPVGYSDHTLGVDTGELAVAAGACILEKHITDDTTAPGPDHASSLPPEDFAEYVALARRAFAMLGPGPKRVQDVERDVREASRQSLVAARRIKAGEVVEAGDLACKRPGTGLAPWMLAAVAGRVATRDIAADDTIVDGDLA